VAVSGETHAAISFPTLIIIGLAIDAFCDFGDLLKGKGAPVSAVGIKISPRFKLRAFYLV
jgi:hypothetical protein